MNVLVLRKVLVEQPEPHRGEGMQVVRVDLLAAGAEWLALRNRAFRDENPPVRPWTPADLHREFGPASRARDRVTWLARDVAAGPPAVCGAVSISLPRPASEAASLHWLMVDPDYRGRGIGSLLLGTAERHCWERGHRVLRLETHRGWEKAVRFYIRHEYQAGR